MYHNTQYYLSRLESVRKVSSGAYEIRMLFHGKPCSIISTDSEAYDRFREQIPDKQKGTGGYTLRQVLKGWASEIKYKYEGLG